MTTAAPTLPLYRDYPEGVPPELRVQIARLEAEFGCLVSAFRREERRPRAKTDVSVHVVIGAWPFELPAYGEGTDERRLEIAAERYRYLRETLPATIPAAARELAGFVPGSPEADRVAGVLLDDLIALDQIRGSHGLRAAVFDRSLPPANELPAAMILACQGYVAEGSPIAPRAMCLVLQLASERFRGNVYDREWAFLRG